MPPEPGRIAWPLIVPQLAPTRARPPANALFSLPRCQRYNSKPIPHPQVTMICPVRVCVLHVPLAWPSMGPPKRPQQMFQIQKSTSRNMHLALVHMLLLAQIRFKELQIKWWYKTSRRTLNHAGCVNKFVPSTDCQAWNVHCLSKMQGGFAETGCRPEGGTVHARAGPQRLPKLLDNS